MNKNVEAGLMVVVLGGGIGLSLGFAFGVLRVTVHAMSTAGVPPAPNAELTVAGLTPLPR